MLYLCVVKQYDEWCLYRAVTEFGSVKHKLTAAFVLCDASKDGTLSEKEVVDIFNRSICIEMRKLLIIGGKKNLVRYVKTNFQQNIAINTRAKKIMSVADKDKDGKITLEEFLGAAEAEPDLFADIVKMITPPTDGEVDYDKINCTNMS